MWNTLDVVSLLGGKAVASKTGHAYVKAKMRDTNAIYGGEMSAHHYFRDFAYCDSGMIPWIIIWELLSQSKASLFELFLERKKCFPSSGEINFSVLDTASKLKQVKEIYFADAKAIDEIDGLSIYFDRWRFNLRQSNTEPLVRLNVETRGDEELLKEKVKELKAILVKE